uniref:RH2 domain-containing protein n=1 Tax=Mesocestoides corti TaxID=53468 RepID=A0A5K3F9S9_MESCO
MERLRISAEEPSDDASVPTSSSKLKTQVPVVASCSSTTGIRNPLMFISHKGDSPYDWGVHQRALENANEVLPDVTLDADGSPFSKLSADERYEELSISEEKSDSGEMGDSSPVPCGKKELAPDFNVSKEVSKLVKENNELEETKNALNVVIHDLLTKLEEQNSEKLQLNETLSQMQISRSSMQLHITQLEADNTRLRKELTDALNAQKELEMNQTPFSKRTRFTREEMAKVLMERNQLQEDICDLREELNWATSNLSEHENGNANASSSANKFLVFFSRLFRKPSRRSHSSVSFDTSTSGVTVNVDGSRSNIVKSLEFVQNSSHQKRDQAVAVPPNWAWVAVPIAAKPCLPQPVVMQSSGVSNTPPSTRKASAAAVPPSSRSPTRLPLPLPLYRRPFPEALSGRMQIDSATCVYVDMGGFRPSGELLAGRSAFFDPEATSSHSSSNPSTDIAEAFSLSSELWVCLTGVVDAAVDWTPLAEQASADSSTHSEPKPVFHSQVVVVDANVPSRYIKSFSLLRSVVTCMAAVPGAAKRDYDVLRLASATWDAIPFTKEAGGTSRSEALSEPLRPTTPPPACSEDEEHQSSFRTDNSLSSLRYFSTSQPDERVVDGCAEADKLASLQPQRDSAFDPDIPRSSSDGRNKDFYRVERQRFTKTASAAPNEDPVEPTTVGTTASMFTAQQTIWLGCQNGDIYLHSGVTAQQVALQTTRLPSAISAIRHFSGRVFVGLANGHIVVFRRQTSPRRSATPTHSSLLASATACPDDDDGGSSCEASQVLAVTSTQGDCRRNQLSIEEELSAADAGGGNWDLSEAVVIRCGPTTQFGVKALVVVPSALTLWAACKNRILVIDTTNFQRLFTIDVASSMGSSVKCMSWIRDGVWVSLRTEPVVRLYNAFTYEPMQELDMAHVILETLGVPGSRQLAVSASVTALGASPDHLWVGTKGGHVACAPFKQKKESRLGCANTSPQSTPIRRASRDSFEHFSPTNRTAQVDLSGISVSVYGHAEAVNFFALVSGPGATTSSSSSLAHTRLASSTPVNPTKTSPSSSATSAAASNSRFLMVSGGVGFVEYRDSSGSDEREKLVAKSQSHLLAWSVASTAQPIDAPDGPPPH